MQLIEQPITVANPKLTDHLSAHLTEVGHNNQNAFPNPFSARLAALLTLGKASATFEIPTDAASPDFTGNVIANWRIPAYNTEGEISVPHTLLHS